MKDVLLKIVDELELIAKNLAALEKTSSVSGDLLDAARSIAAKELKPHFADLRDQVRKAQI